MSAGDPARADWFRRALDANAPPGAGDLPETWAAALAEMSRAFAAGADAAAVVLAYALAEAAWRKAPGDDPEFEWLRERRNRVAHLGDAYPGTAELEADARAAVRIALKLAHAAASR